MRGRAFAVLFGAVWLLAPVASAQDAPAMVSVLTVHVELGSQESYEAGLGEIWKAFKAKGVGAQIFVSTSLEEPGAYAFAVPVASWAEFGTLNEKIGAAYASIPAAMQKVSATIRSWDQEMWIARPDLSYRPAKPRLQDSEMGFTRIALLYAHPDQEAALEQALGTALALRKKHSLGTGTEVYQLAMGSDGPAFAILLNGKDQADFYTQNAKETATMGAEWQDYLQKTGPTLRRVEFTSSLARPDLLFTP
jgi:hypothetical protein